MNLGFFTMPIHPLDKDWRQSLREDREAFILADELGYTEGYVGEHHTDRAENITSSMMFICTLIEATKRIKLGTGTLEHAEQSSGRRGGECRDARSSARRALHPRHLAGRLAVGRRGVRQSRRRPQRDVPRMHQPGAGDLEERAALQHQGQILEQRDRAPADARSRPGLSAQALAEAASADRRDGGRAVLQGRDGGRGARLGSDLGELPDAAMGEDALAEICRGLRARRAPGRSGELARREIDLRRRR